MAGKKNQIYLTDVVAILIAVGLGVFVLYRWLVGPPFELSPTMYCMANLNPLNKSVLVYAEMNRGFLMPYTHVPVAGTDLTEAVPSADYTAVCFADGLVDPLGLLQDQRNFGLVYAGNLLGPAEIFYCPGREEGPYTLKHYPKPWGSAVPEGAEFIFCGYMYNPWVKATTAEGKPFVYEDGLALERHPRKKFLTADLITGPQTISHRHGRTVIWNVGFVDGHVASVESRPLLDLFEDNPDTDWNAWSNWGAVSADGQEPGPGTVRYELLQVLEKKNL